MNIDRNYAAPRVKTTDKHLMMTSMVRKLKCFVGETYKMKKQFTVTDGKMVLILRPAEEGGYTVTSPFDPALITEAETIEEAFDMARDAEKTLKEGRAKLLKKSRLAAASR
jgi:antitoxin HicB